MQAFASLHYTRPSSQTDQEVSYPGYHRIPVEWSETFGDPSVKIEFPIIQSAAEGAASWWAVGTAEVGNGEVLQTAEMSPPLALQETKYIEVAGKRIPLLPNVIIGNFLQLPEGLHPIAAVAYALVNYKQINPEELHPALYEAINDELTRCRVPVIQVTRTAAFNIDAKLSQLNLSGMLSET